MTVGKHKVRSHMTLEYDFSGIRIHEEDIIPVDWKLTVNLIAPQNKKRTKEEFESLAGITYQRIYFWLETNLPHIIVVDTNNEPGMFIANTASNVMMYCPDQPFDEMIIQLLHHKLTALADKALIVGEVHLKGSDVTAGFSYDCPDGEYNLPSTVAEYLPGITMHTIPWWARNDGYCFEFIKPEEQKDTPNDVFFADMLDPMVEFEQVMKENSNMFIEFEPEKEPAKIIQVEKWQPRKV
jgi:hypothetical protein